MKGSGPAGPRIEISETATSIVPVSSFRVHRLLRPQDDLAQDPDDGLLGQVRRVRIEPGLGDDLRDAVVVAQIDERESTQIAPVVKPAAERDLRSGIG